MCHKQNDCEINVYNRKKCPACRFAKCISVGMRLEGQCRMRHYCMHVCLQYFVVDHFVCLFVCSVAFEII